MQLIVYDRHPVAVAGKTRFWLSYEIDALAVGDPLKTWVCFMCLYARDVIAGELLGPYTDATANFFARCALLPEASFLRNAQRTDADLANTFKVPPEQIAERRLDLGIRGTSAWEAAWTDSAGGSSAVGPGKSHGD